MTPITRLKYFCNVILFMILMIGSLPTTSQAQGLTSCGAPGSTTTTFMGWCLRPGWPNTGPPPAFYNYSLQDMKDLLIATDNLMYRVSPNINLANVSGANIGARLSTALTALASTGGVIDARALTGAQAITSNLTWSQNNIKLWLACNTTISVSAGFTITISGARNTIEGCGSASLFDASVGTSSNSIFLLTGDDNSLLNFAIIGNRVAGGSSVPIDIFAGSGLVDRTLIQKMTINDAGSHAIRGEKFSGWVLDNTINTPKASGIRVQSGGQDFWIARNTINGSQVGTSGDAGIFVGCVSTTPCSNRGYVQNNNIYNVGVNGIRVQSASPNYVSYVDVIDNIIDTPGGVVSTEGDGVYYEARHGRVALNSIRRTYAHGIEVAGSTEDVEVATNDIDGVSLNTGSAHSAIELTLGSGATGFAQKNISISDNHVNDTQGTSTTSYVVEVNDPSTGGTGTVTNLGILDRKSVV